MAEKPIITCRYGCGTLLQNFNEAENKYFEYEDSSITHTAERCKSLKHRPKVSHPSVARPTTITPTTTTAPNPIQKAISEPREQTQNKFQLEQDKKTEDIKRAQQERKDQHNEFMIALRDLTREVITLRIAIEKKEWQINSENENSDSESDSEADERI